MIIEFIFDRRLYNNLYEYKDHLGNVRVVTKDVKLRSTTGIPFKTSVLSYSNYYPFGMQYSGTDASTTLDATYESDEYRYGYNGKEKDGEIKGEGNSYDYGFRIYDPRIAKFLSVDPLTKDYPMLTPYQFASNTPIQAIDVDGLEAFFIHGTGSNRDRWYKNENINEGYSQGTFLLKYLSGNKTIGSAYNDFEWGSGTLNEGNSYWNDTEDRTEAALALANHVMNNMNGQEHITLIGHSHGGNVAIQAARIIRERLNSTGRANIKLYLITVATPASTGNEGKYENGVDPENVAPLLEEGTLSGHIHLWNASDPIAGDNENGTTGANDFDSRNFALRYGSASSKTIQIQVRANRELDVDFSNPDGMSKNQHSFDQLAPNSMKRAIDRRNVQPFNNNP